MVREEFLDMLRCIMNLLDSEHKGRKKGMKFSWDNARANADDAGLAKVGLAKDQRQVLPTFSPDMHKAIEHTIFRLKVAFWDAVVQHPAHKTPEQFQQLLRDVFADMPREHIRADVVTLPLTYEMIARKEGEVFTHNNGQYTGVGGGWPPHRYR
jgi:hypothetical protein